MNKLFLSLALGALLFSSCKKEGCTDSSATNFSAEANKDDGTCNFRSTFVVWFNAATATNCVSQSIPSIELFIDGKSHGSTTMVNSSVTEPICNTEEGIRTEIDMNESSKSVSYQIKKTGSSQVLKSGTVSLSAIGCKKVEFTF